MKVGDVVKYPATVIWPGGIGIVIALDKQRQTCSIGGLSSRRGNIAFTLEAVEILNERKLENNKESS